MKNLMIATVIVFWGYVVAADDYFFDGVLDFNKEEFLEEYFKDPNPKELESFKTLGFLAEWKLNEIIIGGAERKKEAIKIIAQIYRKSGFNKLFGKNLVTIWEAEAVISRYYELEKDILIMIEIKRQEDEQIEKDLNNSNFAENHQIH